MFKDSFTFLSTCLRCQPKIHLFSECYILQNVHKGWITLEIYVQREKTNVPGKCEWIMWNSGTWKGKAMENIGCIYIYKFKFRYDQILNQSLLDFWWYISFEKWNEFSPVVKRWTLNLFFCMSDFLFHQNLCWEKYQVEKLQIRIICQDMCRG